uniref:Probable pectate lyase F n=1 Tax=Ditylenchus dipsaci TaxID=166011 RepID=A0A915DN60_9BILA
MRGLQAEIVFPLKMICYIGFLVTFCHFFQTGQTQFWPTATRNVTVNATITVNVSTTFNCNYTRYIPNPTTLGNGGSTETQRPVFTLQTGATLSNCIIGAAPGTEGSADGVHCRQAGCNVTNVWFENVGEDAMSFFGNTSANLAFTVRGGGARNAADKVIQFNGRGTVFVYDFWVDTFTRFARTCGNCAQQYERHFVFSNLTAINGTAGQYVAGINFNYNDSAIITDLKLGGASARNVPACKRFLGVTSGESRSNGTDPDGTYCIYDPADITYLN